MGCKYCTKENCTHCSHCSKEFTSGDHLRRHIQTVHGDGDTYQCNDCEFASNRKDNLSSHIMTVHEQNPEQCLCTNYASTLPPVTVSQFFYIVLDMVDYSPG